MQPPRRPPRWETRHPNLSPKNYIETSEASDEYNCAGWAVNPADPGLWWPMPGQPEYYWPPGARRDNTLEAFVEGFGTLGYEVCDNADLEPGFEKIAVYALHGDSPQHVALQLPDGRWTSKLGDDEDIEHTTLHALTNGPYGRPELFMRRPRGGP
jgi:hypothetical protein